MIADADLARARARLADVVGADVALKPKGRELAGLCPFHDEKTPSFYVVDKGFFHCFGCGAHGTAIDFVMRTRRLDFQAAVHWLLNLPEGALGRCAGVPAQLSAQGDRDSGSADRQHQVDEILRGCGPITDGTAAKLYLWSRSLREDQPALLAHPALYCGEIGKPLPALVAPITDSHGEVCAVQRIWCAEAVEYDGTRDYRDARAPLQTRKKTLGQMRDGAVRLAPPGAMLALAEGVETAIAASMLYRIGTWAVCGAARLGHVWIPPEAQQVIVFGDRGATGEELAERAVGLIHDRGIACQAVFPDSGYGDFSDALIGRRTAA